MKTKIPVRLTFFIVACVLQPTVQVLAKPAGRNRYQRGLAAGFANTLLCAVFILSAVTYSCLYNREELGDMLATY